MVTLSYWIKQKVWGHNLKLAKGDKSQYLLLQKNHFKNILSWSKYCHDIVWWGVWWFPLLLNSVVEVKLPLHFGHANNISLVDEGRVKEIFFFSSGCSSFDSFHWKKTHLLWFVLWVMQWHVLFAQKMPYLSHNWVRLSETTQSFLWLCHVSRLGLTLLEIWQ